MITIFRNFQKPFPVPNNPILRPKNLSQAAKIRSPDFDLEKLN